MVVDTLYRDAPVDKVELPFDLTDAISSAMRSVYKHHSSPEDLIPEELMDGITDILNAAISEDFTTDYPDFTDLIRKNNRVFAAFKTHDQCSRMAELLVDDSGKLKSYNDWVKEAEPISRHHNKVWLRTEYETAVKRAAQAEDWQQFEKDKDVLPNLRWVPSTAVSPAEDHRPFWGTVLPMNHSFWDNHRPGDRWGCQCSLESTDDKPTDMPHTGEIDFPPNDGLENNPGKDGKLFNDTHPYFPSSCNACPFNDGTRKATPTNRAKDCANCKAFNKCQKRSVQMVKTIVKEYENGGKIESYKNIDPTTDDYKRILSSTEYFARQGKHAVITPKFDSPQNCPEYDKIYGSLKGTKYYGKCPDFCVDGVWYEHEGFTTNNPKTNFSNMCSRGLKQSDRIVTEDANLSKAYMERVIDGRLKNGQIISEIWIRSEKKLTLLYKKTDG